MNRSFLGRGWKFPIEVDPVTGHIQMVQDEADVAQAIRTILRTSRGERVMRAEYGCDIREFVFANPDPTTLRMMEDRVRAAILRWEPRVSQVSVQTTADPTTPQVLIEVTYQITSTNTFYNLVYPFYQEESS